MVILKFIIHCYNLKQGAIQLGLDGEKQWNKQETTSHSILIQRSVDMLVDIREKIKLLPISVTLFWVEGYQLHKHDQQSYLGELSDKCNRTATHHWLIRKRQQNILKQLFNDSPWSISMKEELTVCFDTEEIYDHIYEKNRIDVLLVREQTSLSKITRTQYSVGNDNKNEKKVTKEKSEVTNKILNGIFACGKSTKTTRGVEP